MSEAAYWVQGYEIQNTGEDYDLTPYGTCSRCGHIEYGIDVEKYETMPNYCSECGARLAPMATQEESTNPGLKLKYRVFKADSGEMVENCFVLRPDKDDAAWYAVMEYAFHTKNAFLAKDLRNWCELLNEKDAKKALEETR